jgi:hypothetical protein
VRVLSADGCIHVELLACEPHGVSHCSDHVAAKETVVQDVNCVNVLVAILIGRSSLKRSGSLLNEKLPGVSLILAHQRHGQLQKTQPKAWTTDVLFGQLSTCENI